MITPDMTSASPHFTHIKPTGQGVVIHATRSGMSMFPLEFTATLNWFANPTSKVSSHWVIARDGKKCRVIPDHFTAWHAGQHNATHWGIELEQGAEQDGFTPEQIAACVDVCAGYVTDYGVPIARALTGFVGHEDTPQGAAAGKSDPGSLFPWDFFLEALRKETSPVATWEPSEMDIYKTLLDVGHFATQGWQLKDIAPWQKRTLAWLSERANR